MAEKRAERFRMELHLIAPSAVHMLRQAFRETHPLLNGNSCTPATAAQRHFRWLSSPLLHSPPPTSLELAQTTMASHQERGRQNQTLLSDAAEISVQTGRRGHGALWLLCHVDLRFIIKHTHAHTHGLKISAQASANQSQVKLDMLKIFCHFKQIAYCDVSRKRLFFAA